MSIGKYLLTGATALMFAAGIARAAAGPEELVRATTDQALARIEQEHAQLASDPARVFALVEEIIFPHFDFPRISQWVLGSAWTEAPADQREQFLSEFRRLLVRTYSSALLEFSDSPISYGGVHQRADARTAVVNTSVDTGKGQPISISYRMHNADGDWKVFDVSVDGVSLVSTYKASFAAEIRQGGMPRLIASLQTKNSAPAAQPAGAVGR
jgi:phospholipid transport system substrate-binding protein